MASAAGLVIKLGCSRSSSTVGPFIATGPWSPRGAVGRSQTATIANAATTTRIPSRDHKRISPIWTFARWRARRAVAEEYRERLRQSRLSAPSASTPHITNALRWRTFPDVNMRKAAHRGECGAFRLSGCAWNCRGGQSAAIPIINAVARAEFPGPAGEGGARWKVSIWCRVDQQKRKPRRRVRQRGLSCHRVLCGQREWQRVNAADTKSFPRRRKKNPAR